MTKGGRIFAGIFGLIGGGLFCLIDFIVLIIIVGVGAIDTLSFIIFLSVLALGILGVVGGILLLVDKKAGAILALISGTLGIVFIIWEYVYFLSLYGLPPAWAGLIVFLFILPPSMIIVSGIVGMIVEAE